MSRQTFDDAYAFQVQRVQPTILPNPLHTPVGPAAVHEREQRYAAKRLNAWTTDPLRSVCIHLQSDPTRFAVLINGPGPIRHQLHCRELCEQNARRQIRTYDGSGGEICAHCRTNRATPRTVRIDTSLVHCDISICEACSK